MEDCKKPLGSLEEISPTYKLIESSVEINLSKINDLVDSERAVVEEVFWRSIKHSFSEVENNRQSLPLMSNLANSILAFASIHYSLDKEQIISKAGDLVDSRDSYYGKLWKQEEYQFLYEDLRRKFNGAQYQMEHNLKINEECVLDLFNYSIMLIVRLNELKETP